MEFALDGRHVAGNSLELAVVRVFRGGEFLLEGEYVDDVLMALDLDEAPGPAGSEET